MTSRASQKAERLEKKRVAFVLPDMGGGGAERVTIILMSAFIEKGYEVDLVLLRAKGELLHRVPEQVNIFELGATRIRAGILPLAAYFRRRKPLGVQARLWPVTAIAVIARLISGHRFRLVLSEHSILSVQYDRQNWLQRAAMRFSMAITYRAADGVVGVSQGVVNDLSQLALRSPDDFRVIYNPISPPVAPDEIALNAADRLWKGPAGRRILAVGSFKSVKNFPLLLNAFARLVRDQDATLMLLGNGDGEASLRQIATNLGIADRVCFAGFHSDPTPFYQTADLFVLSSNVEGFGNVIVEAMACGVPVVSTDCPSGPAEILDKGRFGTLVPVGDEVALARAMAEALAKPHDQEMLRARAADFSPEKAAAAYLELLT